MLRIGQAVCDALVRRGDPGPSLDELVAAALRARPTLRPCDLVPLDDLLAPWTGIRPVDLAQRARVVVGALELCPEISRGTHTVALALLRSVDEDPHELASAISAVGPTAGLRHRNHAWSLET